MAESPTTPNGGDARRLYLRRPAWLSFTAGVLIAPTLGALVLAFSVLGAIIATQLAAGVDLSLVNHAETALATAAIALVFAPIGMTAAAALGAPWYALTHRVRRTSRFGFALEAAVLAASFVALWALAGFLAEDAWALTPPGSMLGYAKSSPFQALGWGAVFGAISGPFFAWIAFRRGPPPVREQTRGFADAVTANAD